MTTTPEWFTKAEIALDEATRAADETLANTTTMDAHDEVLQGLTLLCAALDLVRRARPHLRKA